MQTQQSAAPAQEPQTTPADQTPAQTKPESTPEGKMDFSKGFAALARKERHLRDRENAWKTERDTFKPKVDEYEKLNNIVSQARTKDPKAIKAALEVLGLSAGDVSQLALTDPDLQEDPKIYEIRQKYEALEKELADLKGFKTKKEQEEAAALEEKEYSSSMGALKSAVDEMLKSNIEKYDLCSCMGDEVYDLVLEIGDQHMQEHDGEILPLDKILELLETREEQRISKFKSSKKFGVQAAGNSNQDRSGTIPPTLTNKNTNGAAPVELAGLTGDARLNAILKKYQKQ